MPPTCQPLPDTKRPDHPRGLTPFPQGCGGSERARNSLHRRGGAGPSGLSVSQARVLIPRPPPRARLHHTGSTCWEPRSQGVAPSKGFPGGSDGKESACIAGEPGLIPGSGRSPGEGNGYPLQCLENPMDREAWWATVHRLIKSQT